MLREESLLLNKYSYRYCEYKPHRFAKRSRALCNEYAIKDSYKKRRKNYVSETMPYYMNAMQKSGHDTYIVNI